MFKIIIYLTITIFLSSCVDLKKRNENTESEFEFVEINNKKALNDQIMISLKRLIKDVFSHMNPDTIKNICYTVGFYDESWNPEICYGKDTVILVSYYTSIGNYDGYRGILLEDDCIIAIIDKNNIGEVYYDRNALLEIGLDELRCVNFQDQEEPRRMMRMLKWKGGKLRDMDGGIAP